jgi:hypothetical protein
MFKQTSIVREEDAESESMKPQDYLSMRKHWWERLVIIKDGAIQGWFISFIFTMVTLVMAILGFLIESIAKNWATLGGTYAPIYLGSLAIWFGYKVAQKKAGNGGGGVNIDSITKTITDAMGTTTKTKTNVDIDIPKSLEKQQKNRVDV